MNRDKWKAIAMLIPWIACAIPICWYFISGVQSDALAWTSISTAFIVVLYCTKKMIHG